MTTTNHIKEELVHGSTHKCNRCLQVKKCDEFSVEKLNKRGHTAFCRVCNRKRRRELYQQNGESERKKRAEYRDKNRERFREMWVENYHRQRDRHPEKVLARKKLQAAVQNGTLIRKDCAVCGDAETHGHHFDYSLPYEVIWLCPSHHRALHKAERSAFARLEENRTLGYFSSEELIGELTDRGYTKFEVLQPNTHHHD